MLAARCSLGFLLAVALGGCGSGSPRFTAKDHAGSSSVAASSDQLEGVASYYADEFHGRRTANGEVYDMHDMTAAHKTLPFGTKVRVVNQATGKSVVVRINDRGPFKDDRIIDLSLSAAKQLGLIAEGTGRVMLEVLEWGTK